MLIYTNLVYYKRMISPKLFVNYYFFNNIESYLGFLTYISMKFSNIKLGKKIKVSDFYVTNNPSKNYGTRTLKNQ
jgi:hypothetical protein